MRRQKIGANHCEQPDTTGQTLKREKFDYAWSHRETTGGGRGRREEANRDVLACVLHQRRTTDENQRRREPDHEGQAHDGHNHNHNYGEDRRLKGRKSCTGKGGQKDSGSKQIVSGTTKKNIGREREQARVDIRQHPHTWGR